MSLVAGSVSNSQFEAKKECGVCLAKMTVCQAAAPYSDCAL